jgi:hypothetical protein
LLCQLPCLRNARWNVLEGLQSATEYRQPCWR